jgi:DNA-binding response OmpR family regulator
VRKVLIIDNDEGICDLLTALLTDEGFQVSIATDSHKALELLQQAEESVVLLDLGRPSSGELMVRAWLEAVHQLSRHQVIAMSASASVAVGRQLLGESLITAFLSKPFNVDEVLAAVQQVAI